MDVVTRKVRRAGHPVELTAKEFEITIARLRRKIDDRFEPKLLHTVRGVGFIMGGDRR